MIRALGHSINRGINRRRSQTKADNAAALKLVGLLPISSKWADIEYFGAKRCEFSHLPALTQNPGSALGYLRT